MADPSPEMEAELYSRIQIHQETEASLSEDFVKPAVIKNRLVLLGSNSVNKTDASEIEQKKSTKERCNPNPFAMLPALNNNRNWIVAKGSSLVNKTDLSIIRQKKSTKERCNPNPFAMSPALNNNNIIPKRLTPYTSYLTQIDSKQVDIPRKNIDRQTNPFNRVNEKNVIPLHSMRLKTEATDICNQLLATTQQKPLKPPPKQITCITIDSESDDELIILPPVIPPIYDVLSSDEENATAEVEPEPQQNKNLDNATCDNPFSGVDASELNETVSFVDEGSNVPIEPIHDFGKPQRTNRYSYEVAENYVAANDVFESESLYSSESVYSKGKKVNRTMSGSDSEDETSNRSKRMRTTRKSKRVAQNIKQEFTCSMLSVHCDQSKEQRGYMDMNGYSSSESNIVTSAGNSSNWLLKDEVGASDDMIDLSIPSDVSENDEMQQNCEEKEQNESNVGDKDDANCVRSKPLVHPEMGWNNEMRAFYNDSWGGESFDCEALRKQMPKDPALWRITEADRIADFNVKTIKCSNCRESGHRLNYCPQPKREIVCYTCGIAGHRSNRCPNAICLQCGAKTNSYVHGCKECLHLKYICCARCTVRGHLERDCPEIWRSYHNTIDSVSSPKYVPNPHPAKKYCSVCASVGHIAEYCYSLKQEMPSTRIRRYDKVYSTNFPLIDNSHTTPYVMFRKPKEDYEFNWDVDESKDRFYGRFMDATKITRNPQIETIKANLRAKRTKRRRQAKRRRLNDDVVMEFSSDGKMVLNPMNPENIRSAATKPKKQFLKGFYGESTKSVIAQSNDCESNIDSANLAAESILENHENEQPEELENGSPECNVDVVMKDIEVVPELTKDDIRANDDADVEETIQSDGGDGVQQIMNREELTTPIDALMLEAIEVDKLRGFGFNREATNFYAVKKLPETNEDAELRELSEDEKTLEHLKRRLSTLKKPKDFKTEQKDHDADLQLPEYIPLSSTRFESTTNITKDFKTEQKDHDADLQLPEYIPLSSTRFESTTNTTNQAGTSQRFINPPSSTKAKIYLSKEHTRMLLTEAGNNFLRESSMKMQIKVTMGWESVGNILMVVGSKLNQDKFYEDLVKYFQAINKKNRLRNETLQLLPKSKVALIRFIREQFTLLLQPLGNPQLLYKNMRINEDLKTKDGTKNANESRIKLNAILMGQGGLRDGPKHLSGLEKKLKFLLENNKDMMTKQFREEVFQHYRYIFSSYTHDNYPELISEFNELKNSNNLPELNVDYGLFEMNIDEDCRPVDLDLAKRKLMHMKNEESQQRSGKLPQIKTISPKLDTKSPKADTNSPKQDPKSSKISKSQSTENGNIESKGSGNTTWSLKCKKMIEECRKLPQIRGYILQKFDLLMEKANNHGLSEADFINLNRIKKSLIQTQN